MSCVMQKMQISSGNTITAISLVIIGSPFTVICFECDYNRISDIVNFIPKE